SPCPLDRTRLLLPEYRSTSSPSYDYWDAHTGRGNRDVSKHRYGSPDVCRIEELRIVDRARPLKMFGLLAGKQVRLRDRVVGTEKETERDRKSTRLNSSH